MQIEAGDHLFLDTNILLIATDEGRDHHDSAVGLFSASFRKGINLVITGQIIREYLVVATRSREGNGLGIAVREAVRNICEFKRFCYFYSESENVASRVIQLVQEYSLSGNMIHDVNIVAVMEENGISKLVTENRGDFQRYKGIDLVNLETIQRFVNMAEA